MGLLELKAAKVRERERRQLQTQGRNGSITSSRAKRKGSTLQQDCVPHRAFTSPKKNKGSSCQEDDSSGPYLPEEIWCHVHSLMPMRDAARHACVSRAFLCSWRCHPNLIFSNQTLGLNGNVCTNNDIATEFTSKVDHILKNHSGIGVKTFELFGAPDFNEKDRSNLNSWLQMAVTPGIEELTFILYSHDNKYNFPCSLLSNGNGDSIRHLRLSTCAFRPIDGLGCLRSLSTLVLSMVQITGDELGHLLSSSFALERLTLENCSGIFWVKIPCLQRLRYLEVFGCNRLTVIESKAPNLSSFRFTGNVWVQLSLEKALLQLKKLYMCCSSAVCHSLAELGSSMPNLEALSIKSTKEMMVDTPVAPSKFPHLKYLSITLFVTLSPSYDYFSLVSFIDASPCLETLVLDVRQRRIEHVSVLGDPSELRQMPENKHDKLKIVKMSGFSSAKSLVELACHILGSATSLERFILDTQAAYGFPSCSVNKVGKCYRMERGHIEEAHRALSAVEIYIKPKVPSTVSLKVVKPCSRCCQIVGL